MRKITITLIFLLVILFLPAILTQVEAASLKYSPTTVTTTTGSTFQVEVDVDAGSEQITSTDVYVIFDASVLEAQSVSAGSFFPTVTNNITSGRVYIAGMVDDPATSKTGSGALATVTFKALKDGGVTLSFDCSSSKIVKNDVNASNIITCSSNGTATVTVGAGATPTTTTTTGGDTTEAGTTPTQLPQSGVFDNMLKWSQWGIVLVILGGAIRLLLL